MSLYNRQDAKLGSAGNSDLAADGFADEFFDGFADEFLDEFADFDDSARQNLAGRVDPEDGINPVHIQVTPDMLLESLGSDSDYKEPADDNDPETQDICNALMKQGFYVADTGDVEKLSLIGEYAKRCEIIESGNYVPFVEHISKQCYDAIDKLAASRATFRTRDSRLSEFRANVTNNNNDKELAVIQLISINIINERVEKLAREHSITDSVTGCISGLDPDMISTSEIINALARNTTVSSVLLNQHLSEIISYINTVKSVIMNDYKNDHLGYVRESAKRQAMARMLMRTEIDMEKKLREAENRLQFVHQMWRDYAENLYIKCSKCGKLHALKSVPMTFVFFPSESGYISNFSPLMETCSCGDVFIFPLEYYLLTERRYMKNYNAEIRNVISQTPNLSTGAAFLRVTPPLNVLESELSFLISEFDAEDNNTPESFQEKSPAAVAVDLSEFRKAVDQFYQRLNGFDQKHGACTGSGTSQTDLPESVDYKIMAYYVAQCTGHRYDELKMQSFYSLLTFFSENPVLSAVLDGNELSGLKNKSLVIRDNDYDFSLLSYEAYGEMVRLCYELCDDSSVVEKAFSSGRNKIKQLLYAKIDVLEEKIRKQLHDYNEIITDLEQCIVPLSYCKIIAYQSCSVSTVVRYVRDERIFNLLDLISDRMIINNYAGDFYDYWKTLNKVKKGDLENVLVIESSSEQVSGKIEQILEKKLCFTGIDYEEWFASCFEMSPIRQEPFHRCTTALKNCNYYKFCKELAGIGHAAEIPLGREYFASTMKSVFAKLDEARKVVSRKEYEFYLSRDFTQEELDASSEEFSMLIFGRYVPKRQKHETPCEYIERYNRSAMQGGAVAGRCYDNAEYFRSFSHLAFISCSSLLYDIQYHNYMTSTFMASLIHALMAAAEPDYMRDVLGITKTHLNTISRTMHRVSYSDVSFGDNAALNGVLNGYYFTGISDLMYNVGQKFSHLIVKPSAGLKELHKNFSLKDELADVFEKASLIIRSSEDSEDDLERAADEVRLFADNDDFFHELQVVGT